MLATLTIEPPPAASIAGIAACIPSSVPVALTASRRFQSSSVSSTIGVTWTTPALLTSTRSVPRADASATAAAQSAGEVTSRRR